MLFQLGYLLCFLSVCLSITLQVFGTLFDEDCASGHQWEFRFLVTDMDDDVPLAELLARRRAAKVTLVVPNDLLGEEDDDVPIAELLDRHSKRSRKKNSSRTNSASKKRSTPVNGTQMFSVKKYEALDSIEPLQASKLSNKWWNKEETNSSRKWTTLRHNGVLFPPPYEPHGIPVMYKGKPVELIPEQEEVATFYAQMLETDFIHNPKFKENFFRDWSELLGKDHIIQDFDQCDFQRIYDHIIEAKERRKAHNKLPEEKAQKKIEKEWVTNTYGYAIVDDCKQKVGNFRVEPPGLFRGRGEHPKVGTLKKRVMPEDIIINIGEGEKIPKCPIEGHSWKGIVHNPHVTWLAFWTENVSGGTKYIWLHPSSQFKGQSDVQKYEKARKLKDYIGKIRKEYMKEMDSSDLRICQRATALWIIDILALRVGNEKDTDDEADTVGCCSLRVEHITFTEPNIVNFDFLGKDSMRYLNSVKVIAKVYRNLKKFVRKKSPRDQVFDELTTAFLNQYLKTLMDGLTAKVFRTYNASVTLEKELCEHDHELAVTANVPDKLYFYNNANREVAILCNHQRTVSKNHDTQMEKLDSKMQKLQEQKEFLKRNIAFNKGEDIPSEPEFKKTDPKKLEVRLEKLIQRITKAELQRKTKEDNKAVALSTAKINYMDPRITVAWCKTRQVPIEKIFNKSALQRFPWAMEVKKDWRF